MNTKFASKFARIGIAVLGAIALLAALSVGLALAQSGGPLADTQVVAQVTADSTPLRSQPTLYDLTGTTNTNRALGQNESFVANLAFQAIPSSTIWVRLGREGDPLKRSELGHQEEWVSTKDVGNITGTVNELPHMAQTWDYVSRTVTRTVWQRVTTVVSQSASWGIGAGLNGWDKYTIYARVPISITSDGSTPLILSRDGTTITITDTQTLPAGIYTTVEGSGGKFWSEDPEDTNVVVVMEFEETYELEPGLVPATGADPWLIVGIVALHILVIGAALLIWRSFNHALRERLHFWERRGHNIAPETPPADADTNPQD